MPVKKYKDPSTVGAHTKKDLKAPNAEPKATPLNGNISVIRPSGIRSQKSSNTLTLRERTPNGGLLAEPTSNSSPLTKKYNKDYLKDRWQTLSGRMMDWLHQDDRLEQMMAETKLRDIGVMLGIATEKVLLLEGQPTQIISQPQHQAIDRLGVALKDALEKRGLVTLTERKVEIKTDERQGTHQSP